MPYSSQDDFKYRSHLRTVDLAGMLVVQQNVSFRAITFVRTLSVSADLAAGSLQTLILVDTLGVPYRINLVARSTIAFESDFPISTLVLAMRAQILTFVDVCNNAKLRITARSNKHR